MKHPQKSKSWLALVFGAFLLAGCNPVSLQDSSDNPNRPSDDSVYPTTFDNNKECLAKKRRSFPVELKPTAGRGCLITEKNPLRTLSKVADNVSGFLYLEFSVPVETTELRYESYRRSISETIKCKKVNNGSFECPLPSNSRIILSSELEKLAISQQRNKNVLHLFEISLKTEECPDQAWRYKVDRSDECSTEETLLTAYRESWVFPAIEIRP